MLNFEFESTLKSRLSASVLHCFAVNPEKIYYRSQIFAEKN